MNFSNWKDLDCRQQTPSTFQHTLPSWAWHCFRFFKNNLCQVFNTRVHHSHDKTNYAKGVLILDLKEEIQFLKLLKCITCSVISTSVILKSCWIKLTGRTWVGVNWSNDWSLKSAIFSSSQYVPAFFFHQLEPKQSTVIIDIQLQLGNSYFICVYLIKLERHIIKSRQICFPNVTVCQKVTYSYFFYSIEHKDIAGEDIKMSAIIRCHRQQLGGEMLRRRVLRAARSHLVLVGNREAPGAGAPRGFMGQGQGLVKRCFPGMLIHLKPIFAFDS